MNPDRATSGSSRLNGNPEGRYLAGCGKIILIRKNFDGLHVWHNKMNIIAGCSKRPSSKAAASEGPRRYRPHFV
jgi:hypothetical protein